MKVHGKHHGKAKHTQSAQSDDQSSNTRASQAQPKAADWIGTWPCKNPNLESAESDARHFARGRPRSRDRGRARLSVTWSQNCRLLHAQRCKLPLMAEPGAPLRQARGAASPLQLPEPSERAQNSP